MDGTALRLHNVDNKYVSTDMAICHFETWDRAANVISLSKVCQKGFACIMHAASKMKQPLR